MLLNAIVTAIAYPDNNGIAEVFDGEAEGYQVIVKVVNSHDELSPVPYKD
ncbi:MULTISPECIES: hypothetical protein [Nostocaceae]|nr:MULTISPECIES: hypothetical protein [Nostocaceae]